MSNQTLLDQFPTPEDWVHLQGGRPRVFGTPDAANDGLFYVVHDYGYSSERAKPPLDQAGLVVPTPTEQMLESVGSPIGKMIYTVGGVRNVRVPAVMLAQHHGLACEQVSREAGHNRGYKRIRQGEIGQYTTMAEYRLGVVASGAFVLRQMPKR